MPWFQIRVHSRSQHTGHTGAPVPRPVPGVVSSRARFSSRVPGSGMGAPSGTWKRGARSRSESHTDSTSGSSTGQRGFFPGSWGHDDHTSSESHGTGLCSRGRAVREERRSQRKIPMNPAYQGAPLRTRAEPCEMRLTSLTRRPAAPKVPGRVGPRRGAPAQARSGSRHGGQVQEPRRSLGKELREVRGPRAIRNQEGQHLGVDDLRRVHEARRPVPRRAQEPGRGAGGQGRHHRQQPGRVGRRLLRDLRAQGGVRTHVRGSEDRRVEVHPRRLLRQGRHRCHQRDLREAQGHQGPGVLPRARHRSRSRCQGRPFVRSPARGGGEEPDACRASGSRRYGRLHLHLGNHR